MKEQLSDVQARLLRQEELTLLRNEMLKRLQEVVIQFIGQPGSGGKSSNVGKDVFFIIIL